MGGNPRFRNLPVENNIRGDIMNNKKPTAFSHEMKVRLKKASTLESIKALYETKRFESVNAIVNSALEKGLPLLEGKKSDATTNQIAELIAFKVANKLSPMTDKILLNMKKITILQTVQESMLSSLIQELEFYLKTKGISIDPEILMEFKDTLPERFDEDKTLMIESLFSDAEDVSQAYEQESDEDDE